MLKYKYFYFATSNQSKLNRLIKILTKVNEQFVVKMIPDLIEVPEKGKTSLENSKMKILPYVGKYTIPIISCNTSIFMKGENIEPTHIKRTALKSKGVENEMSLSVFEIANIVKDYYLSIAKKYGGKKEFYYEDSWTILFPNGQIRQIKYTREYILTDTPKGDLDIFMPMRQLYYSKKTQKRWFEQTDEEFFFEFQSQIIALKKLLICHTY